MSEHNVHRQHRERVKNRFLAEGMDHMPPHNALELLLFYAIPQGDVNGLAHRLIERFGSYSAVIDAPYEQLLEVDGIGPHAATLLKLLPASARYYAADKCRDITLDTTEKALHYFIDLYLGIGDEQVYLTCLDGKSKVISSALLHRGSINSVAISMRKLAQTALNSGAVGVIIAHNHPGGVALPSQEDLITTGKILQLLAQLGITLVDHIVVADNDAVSLAQSGSIPQHQKHWPL